MAIFNTRQSNYGEPEYEIMGTTEALDQILMESKYDEYQLSAGLRVSDIMLESAVLYEGAQIEPLFEGLVGDAMSKLKAMFVKLKAKLKAWFEQVKRFFELMYKTGKAFTDRFANEINAKETKGFEYTAYLYDLAALRSASDKMVNSISKETEAATHLADYSRYDMADLTKELQKEMDVDYTKDVLNAKMGVKDEADLVKQLTEACRGKDTKDVKEFNKGASKSTMISEISGKTNTLAAIKDNNTELDKTLDDTIRAIEDAEKKYVGETTAKAGVLNLTRKKCSNARTAIARTQRVNNVVIELTKEACRTYESILKRFLKYKPSKVKEGYDGNDLNDSDSLLEQAMHLI